MSYVGRFAPSPTGQLHLGTLTAAIASWLHARQAGGTWLVRIEDIDPPREVPGSADRILRTLERLGLAWDREVLIQSRRIASHLADAEQLISAGKAYYCNCSRRQIRAKTRERRYPGTCRYRGLTAGDAAMRLRVDDGRVTFTDGLQGRLEYDIEASDGDFVVVRRDRLPAYHLAVVLDDAEQGVTDVVRGVDLLDSTPLHIHLQHAFGLPTPRYWHIPLITNAAGEKLSKSTGAEPVDTARPGPAIAQALEHLGVVLPGELEGAPPGTIWQWAAEHWVVGRLRGRRTSTELEP